MTRDKGFVFFENHRFFFANRASSAQEKTNGGLVMESPPQEKRSCFFQL